MWMEDLTEDCEAIERFFKGTMSKIYKQMVEEGIEEKYLVRRAATKAYEQLVVSFPERVLMYERPFCTSPDAKLYVDETYWNRDLLKRGVGRPKPVSAEETVSNQKIPVKKQNYFKIIVHCMYVKPSSMSLDNVYLIFLYKEKNDKADAMSFLMSNMSEESFSNLKKPDFLESDGDSSKSEDSDLGAEITSGQPPKSVSIKN